MQVIHIDIFEFKLDIKLQKSMQCNFDNDSHLAAFFAKTELIVWDEASMVFHHLLNFKKFTFYKAHKWIIDGTHNINLKTLLLFI